jgi:hypothetical protein
MEPANDSVVLPACQKVGGHKRRLKYAGFGIRFDVARNVNVVGGPDVDYAEYVITTRAGGAAMQLWLGGRATDREPDDRYFTDSVSFEQRWVVDEKGALVGIDSSGRLRIGTEWRWMSGTGGGVVYEKASVQDRNFFDQIISAACLEARHPAQ